MTTNATPDLLCPNCPDDRCAGFHHAVGDPCGCFLLPLACAACGHEDETHGRAGACDLCPRGVCQPIDTDADAEADAVATMNALILPDAFGDDAPAIPAPLPDAGQPGAASGRLAPSCPSWCTEAAEHVAEAADPGEEAYLHARRLNGDASPYCVEVVAWQRFAGGVLEPAGVRVWSTGNGDLSPADARACAEALMGAALLAEGGVL